MNGIHYPQGLIIINAKKKLFIWNSLGRHSWLLSSRKAWDFVYVSGTTATEKEGGNIIGKGNSYAQTIQIIKNVEMALQTLGATLKDVVRTRIYVIDINNWQEVGRAHAEYFKQIRPSTTMVEVSRLINPEILVEMEVDAIITDAELSKLVDK